MSRDDMIAALDWAVKEAAARQVDAEYESPYQVGKCARRYNHLRALADALREAEDAWQSTLPHGSVHPRTMADRQEDWRFYRPVLILPEPKVKP